MVGTILSIAFAIFLRFYSQLSIPETSWNLILFFMIFLALVLLIIQAGVQVFAWRPLIEAGRSITSRVADLLRKDFPLRLSNFYLNLFPLITLVIILGMLLYPQMNKIDLLAVWIVLAGAALDALHFSFKRIRNYLNPFSVIKFLTHEAKSDVQEDREMDLCDTIDALSEVAIKGLENSSTSLPNESLDELQIIIRNFLKSSKSIAHPVQDAESKKMGLSDKITYNLFFLFQRLELINDKAIEKHLEPVCSAVITTLGKITIHSAKLDLSLSSYPLTVIGRCSKKSQENRLADVGEKALITLQEIAKTIISEIDLTYQELQDPFSVLISEMHDISNEIFKQNKQMDIEQLRMPFRQLRELFEKEKMVNHPDTAPIVSQINQVIAEFDTLELVMKTIPPLNVTETKEGELRKSEPPPK